MEKCIAHDTLQHVGVSSDTRVYFDQVLGNFERLHGLNVHHVQLLQPSIWQEYPWEV